MESAESGEGFDADKAFILSMASQPKDWEEIYQEYFDFNAQGPIDLFYRLMGLFSTSYHQEIADKAIYWIKRDFDRVATQLPQPNDGYYFYLSMDVICDSSVADELEAFTNQRLEEVEVSGFAVGFIKEGLQNIRLCAKKLQTSREAL